MVLTKSIPVLAGIGTTAKQEAVRVPEHQLVPGRIQLAFRSNVYAMGKLDPEIRVEVQQRIDRLGPGIHPGMGPEYAQRGTEFE